MGNAGDDQGVVDIIRKLPDAIVVKILSILPTRDAVRTLIIPSFGNLWTSVYNLDFDWCQFHDCPNNSSFGYEGDVEDEEDEFGSGKFRRFVRSVLANHRGDKINKFHINFEYGAIGYSFYDEDREMEMEFSRLSGEVDSWIEFTVNKGVDILEIDLMACKSPAVAFKYSLPSSTLQTGSLTSLKLVSCNVGAYEIIRKFLAGCPLLESLSIASCLGLGELNCDSRRLNTLTRVPRITEESKLRVMWPYVTSLTISGGIGRSELENISGLQDVSIDAFDFFRHVPDDYLKVRKIFEGIHHVRDRTMQHHPVQVNERRFSLFRNCCICFLHPTVGSTSLCRHQ